MAKDDDFAFNPPQVSDDPIVNAVAGEYMKNAVKKMITPQATQPMVPAKFNYGAGSQN